MNIQIKVMHKWCIMTVGGISPVLLIYWRALMASGTAKWSPITIGIEPHVCIEIESHATLFSWST